MFDDGYDGVVVIDLDSRRAARHLLDGQRAGDQPYRLLRSGEHLVVGWEQLFAVSLATGTSRPIVSATIALPAVEPGQVWVVDYPGGRIGQGIPTFRAISNGGAVVVEREGLDPLEGDPAIGIPQGVALNAAEGVHLWNAYSGDVRTLYAASQGFVADADSSVLVWCAEPCTQLRITDLVTAQTMTASLDGRRFDAASARLSPNGRHVAAVVFDSPELILIDVRTGDLTSAGSLWPYNSLSWSPDSSAVWAASFGYEASTSIARYDVATRRRAEWSLGFAAGLTFEVLARAESHVWLPTGEQGECNPPSVYPSGRTEPCSFALPW